MINRAIVLDTNVLVSAGIHLATPPHAIVDLVLDGELVMFLCPAVVQECCEVLDRPRLTPYAFPPAWLPLLLECGILRHEDPQPWPHPGPDADDRAFLALARQEGAVLVTGNVADYPEAIREGVAVQSPREFLDAWKEGPDGPVGLGPPGRP